MVFLDSMLQSRLFGFSSCRSGLSEHGCTSTGSQVLSLTLKHNHSGPTVPSCNASCSKSPLLEDFLAEK